MSTAEPIHASVRLRWDSGGATDKGRVRSVNQDSLLDRPDLGIWSVADGMGGHSDGGLASRTLVELLGTFSHQARLGRAAAQARRLILAANDRLLGLAGPHAHDLIGSTVVALVAVQDHAACLWVGDSRIYLLRDDRLEQLTTDHSRVQSLVDAGMLAPEQADSHPCANELMRAVGADPDLEVDLHLARLKPGDRLLLCSDGLFRELAPDEISRTLGALAPAESAPALVRAACEHGGRDNVTAVAVRIAAA